MTTPAPAAMDDAAWLALCVFYEARGECDDGKAAVARVILNRAHHQPRPFFSDGSIKGTVLWPSQFSWTCFTFVNGRYVKVAFTRDDVEARAERLYAQALADHAAWDSCWGIAAKVKAGTYEGGSAYQKLGPDALLYDNLAVSQPVWAIPSKLIAVVGRHSFFRP